MKFSSFVVGAALSSSVIAFPGMAGNKKMMDFHKGLTRRALTPNLKPRGGKSILNTYILWYNY